MCSAQKQSSNTYRFKCFVLDIWIVSLADWYLAILTTFITEKSQFLCVFFFFYPVFISA